MPPKPSPAADRYRPLGAPPPSQRLRDVPAGYDLHPLPFHIAPHDGESPVSWLRRLAVRYDVAARDLLKTAGARQPAHSTRRAVARLRNNRRLLLTLGLNDDEARRLIRPTPLTTATTDYLTTLRGGEVTTGHGSRYCPSCLAEPDPHWPDHWQNPLSLICVRHRCYLTYRCPSCHQPPHATTAWLGAPVPLTDCPSRLGSRPRPASRQLRPWCGHDLTQAPVVPVPAEQVAGQQLLHTWAVGSADRTSACCVTITSRIGFCALVELADAALGQNCGLFDLDADPVRLGVGIADAARVLTQPSLDAAADAARGLLAAGGPHAPLTSVERIEHHPYSPLLAAIQLHSVRDRLSPAEQLMFRTVHPAPRYPAPVSRDNRTRLRLPDHHPWTPEPAIAWIPQRLWWNAIPAGLVGCDRRWVRDTTLAVALAKVGCTRSWAELCADLDLPANHPAAVHDLIRDLTLAGMWPAVRDHLDRLMAGLQHHPPPVDYQARRALGHNLDLLTDALDAGHRRHPTASENLTLLRMFWKRLTGGDIAYAPDAIRLDPDSSAYTAFQHTLGVRHSDLFHVAHRQLSRTGGIDGPLTWSPAGGIAAA